MADRVIKPDSGNQLVLQDEGGSASITIATDGVTTFAENIKIAATKGINFSAYATSGNPSSNLLDDYEEGTWSPVLSDGTNNASHSSQAGSYTKIGRMVRASASISLSSLGSVSGDLRIKDLPFSSTSSSSLCHANVICGRAGNTNITAGESITGWIDTSSDFFYLELWDSSGGTSSLQSTEINSNLWCQMEISYLTDA